MRGQGQRPAKTNGVPKCGMVRRLCLFLPSPFGLRITCILITELPFGSSGKSI